MTGKRLVPVLALGLSVAGCTGFSYISKTYVSLTPQVVTIGCNDPYEIYDQRQQRRMLVVSNALREVTGCGLGGRFEGLDPGESRTQRFRLAARTYLDETVREDCQITGETIFTDLQTEFAYACAGPVEPRGAKVPRLPGRGGLGVGQR
ncbi:hypothetical protein [Methylobacterium nigriterrae]|uniref:hypothetical protein n=1 Tax=Methylobacterium nigriterrae TaxID=3127512 RepID=UPI003013CFA4